jgi:hypothetical protein
LNQGYIGLFMEHAFDGYTNFDAALEAVNDALAGEPAGERNVVFFLSDGNPCGLGQCSPGNWP